MVKSQCILNEWNTQTGVSHPLTPIPEQKHSSVLAQLEAKTPYASVFFQSHSPHAVSRDSPAQRLEDIWCTPWMLLSLTVKSWAIPEGDGTVSEGIRLGQEAALCSGRWGNSKGEGNDIQELKKTMASSAPSSIYPPPKNTCRVYLDKQEMRGWSLPLRETTMASNREMMKD